VEARSCSQIKTALQQAQRAGVDPEEIQDAEKLYKKLDALESLADAVKVGESSGIKLSLQMAVTAGVEVDALQEATKALQDLGQRRRASVSAVEMPLPAPTPQKDVVMGKVGECLENLNHAIGTKETSALKMAINVAQPFHDFNIPEVVVLVKEAQKILGATGALRLLQTAERAKKPDIAKLREAVSKAEEFGIDEFSIAPCRSRLQQLEVCEGLSKAMSKKDCEQLQEAIRKAHEVAFSDRAKLVKAEKALVVLQARDALQVVADDFTGDNAETLLIAIGNAKAAGVEKKDIGMAELKLKGVNSIGKVPSLPRLRRASQG
jgi:hypothetical protein